MKAPLIFRGRLIFPLGVLWAVFGGAFTTLMAENPTPEQMNFFEGKVRPLLVKHCYDCHSTEAEKIKGGLLLDSREGWLAGGDSGEVIIPGKPGSSLLMETVRYADPDLQMPPKYKLSVEEITVLEDWIAMEAPDPRLGEAVVAKASRIDWEKGKQHWAFQPIRHDAPPKVTGTDWVRDELDRYILAKIEAAGLQPAPDADRFAIIRRVTLDLTGLPPTVEEVGAFVRDPGSDDEALTKVVDRLLKFPAFGERWGRHWLDVARYADSVGKTRNVPFPYAWRYRNYVIDAFNADKPYDVFLSEQIAGDLLPAGDEKDREQHLVATGLLALGSMDLNEKDSKQFQLDRIDDQMDTLGRATMGLTLGCARCHDHKFDPIAQNDYYAMAGIFSSTRTLSGQSNKQGGNKSYFDSNLLVNLKGSAPGLAKTAERVAPQAPSTPDSSAEIAQLRQRLRNLESQGKKKGGGPAKRAELKKQLTATRQQLTKLTRESGGAATPANNKKKESQRADRKSRSQRDESDGRHRRKSGRSRPAGAG